MLDEVSMARADLMDCLDRFLKGARESRLPFGGVKMILTGDLAQLPPVIDMRGPEARVSGPAANGRGPGSSSPRPSARSWTRGCWTG